MKVDTGVFRLGTCLGLWRFLRMAGTSLGGIWLEHLQKLESSVRVLQVFRYEIMYVFVPKNRVTSRRSGQRRDVPESYIMNIATFMSNFAMFQHVRLPTLQPSDATSQRSREACFSTSQRSREACFSTSLR